MHRSSLVLLKTEDSRQLLRDHEVPATLLMGSPVKRSSGCLSLKIHLYCGMCLGEAVEKHVSEGCTPGDPGERARDAGATWYPKEFPSSRPPANNGHRSPGPDKVESASGFPFSEDNANDRKACAMHASQFPRAHAARTRRILFWLYRRSAGERFLYRNFIFGKPIVLDAEFSS